ncbi:MAG: molybdenum transporter, periplasmic molybdate-binding protein [Caproiciproducens sp.]|nr:molybdenum transporter, periplasmic molybdate-binding protein [Caproiciproducens sp.]
MKKFYCALLTGLMIFAAGCTSNSTVSSAAPAASAPASSAVESKAAEKVELMVSAAASLTDCMNEIKTAYAAEHPDTTITYNFGSSGSLQQQIEQGAPCDIFFSAGKKQMKALQDKSLVAADSVKDVLQNQVVLITPKNGRKIASFADLTAADIKKIGVGEPKSVPVGQYTAQVFEKMKLTDKLSSKLVYAKDVREVLSWVETGNVQAGIVYATDAKISDKVEVSCVAPEDSHDKVVYPLGIIKDSKHADAAKQFVDYLLGADAKKIFTKYGFSSLV